MATPLGHALGGYLAYKIGSTSSQLYSNEILIICLVLAVSPDLDFLPGILIGKPALYHQGITHSLVFAGIASFVAAVACRRFRRWQGTFFSLWTLFGLAYGSHLVIDLFGPDHRLPYGIPLFWPLSDESYLAPFQVFMGVHHATASSNTTNEWVSNIFDLYNLGAIGVEVLVVWPFILVVGLVRRFARRDVSPAPGQEVQH